MRAGGTYIKGGVGHEQRDSHVEADLKEGVYFFYVEMDWKIQESYTDFEFCGTSYGPADAIIEEVTKDFKKENILSRVIMAEALNKENDMYLRVTMEDKNAPQIMKISTKKKSESGYLWTIVDNGEKDKKFKQVVNYTKFEGLTLMPPYSGTSYELNCEPGNSACVVIKCNIDGHAYTEQISEQIIMPDDSLIDLCLSKGSPCERAPGIVQIEYVHSSGVIFVYKNTSDCLTLSEQIRFELEGL